MEAIERVEEREAARRVQQLRSATRWKFAISARLAAFARPRPSLLQVSPGRAAETLLSARVAVEIPRSGTRWRRKKT